MSLLLCYSVILSKGRACGLKFFFFVCLGVSQVDDSNSTLVSIGNELTGMFGTTFGFHDFFTKTLVKVRLFTILLPLPSGLSMTQPVIGPHGPVPTLISLHTSLADTSRLLRMCSSRRSTSQSSRTSTKNTSARGPRCSRPPTRRSRRRRCPRTWTNPPSPR